MLKLKLERRTIQISKVAESWVLTSGSTKILKLTVFNFCSYISYFEQYREFDYFLAPPDYPNPWTSDNTELWEMKWVLFFTNKAQYFETKPFHTNLNIFVFVFPAKKYHLRESKSGVLVWGSCWKIPLAENK